MKVISSQTLLGGASTSANLSNPHLPGEVAVATDSILVCG